MEPGHPSFEAAAGAVHDGDLPTLVALLDAHPDLVHTRSEHGVTLVHHVACNGVERQQDVPPVEILDALLSTALGAARHHQHDDIAALLEAQ